jgi:hypothetical protein
MPHDAVSDPAARLRIIVLTDGVDYKSITQAHGVTQRLQSYKIKVDLVNLLGPM